MPGLALSSAITPSCFAASEGWTTIISGATPAGDRHEALERIVRHLGLDDRLHDQVLVGDQQRVAVAGEFATAPVPMCCPRRARSRRRTCRRATRELLRDEARHDVVRPARRVWHEQLSPRASDSSERRQYIGSSAPGPKVTAPLPPIAMTKPSWPPSLVLRGPMANARRCRHHNCLRHVQAETGTKKMTGRPLAVLWSHGGGVGSPRSTDIFFDLARQVHEITARRDGAPASNRCVSDTERLARRRGSKTFNGGATHKKMTGPNRPVSFRLAKSVRFSRFRLGS